MINIKPALFASLLLLSFSAKDALAQTVIKNFQLRNVMDNAVVSLDSYASGEGLVLIFTSNDCPYDGYYRDRIAKLSTAYQKRVPVVLVNSLVEPGESAEEMITWGKRWNIKVPYLADKEQMLMTNLGVKKTPEAFLLKNQNGKFIVVYRGAIDDNAQVEADVRHRYLFDAIELMINNQKIPTPEVRPVGCNVKKKA